LTKLINNYIKLLPVNMPKGYQTLQPQPFCNPAFRTMDRIMGGLGVSVAPARGS